MWSFEGDYKSKPKQSLSGKSRALDRQAFLNKLKNERNQREESRRKQDATIKIQAWMRGHLCRIKLLKEQRKIADGMLINISEKGLNKESAEKIISHLIKIFNVKKDSARILSVCYHLIRQKDDLSKWVFLSFEKWKFLLPRLIGFALQTLSVPCDVQDKAVSSHGAPLRLLEIILSPAGVFGEKISTNEILHFHSIFIHHLLENGYYYHLVSILLKKVPEVYDPSITPMSPLCESLLALFLQPIIIFNVVQDGSLGDVLISELVQQVLAQSHHSQICHYILPHLATSSKFGNKFLDKLVHYAFNNLNKLLAMKRDASFLFSYLAFANSQRGIFTMQMFSQFLHIIGAFLSRYSTISHKSFSDNDDSDSDSSEELETCTLDPQIEQLRDKNLKILNESEFVSWILQTVEKYVSHDEIIINFSILFHHILLSLKYQLHICKMLYSVANHRNIILRPMWRVLTAMHQGSLTNFGLENPHFLTNSYGMPLLHVLSFGYPLTPNEKETLIPLLSTFSATLIAVLSTLHDSEFLGENGNYSDGLNTEKKSFITFPFSVEEVVKMSSLLRDVCVGLTELAHPDMRMADYIDGTHKVVWANCLKVCVGVVRHIHLRDTRRKFCPENHWLSNKVFIPQKDESAHASIIQPRGRRRNRRLFQPPQWVSKDDLGLEGPQLSIADQRRMTLLQEIPFVFPFEARMGLFSSLICKDRKEHQATASYSVGPSITVSIRRTHIYEDAFDKLSVHNEANMRLKMRVRLMNVTGLDEAGIDGGGIFREFLSELLKTAFDPTRGFFLLTKDNALYPNPGANLVVEEFEKHYFFIGRMVGKALYENLLVEIPMAGFFLSKLLCGSSSVEFHYLDSLDPELCKNILSLKTYSGDISELGLDFTVLNSYLGQNTVEELLPNGSNIAVTSENVIEYIYRMADFKLNRQIARHCQAFKEGVFDVIDARWLRLFNWRELQMLISGASTPINLEDLKQNTKYSGVYNEEHPTILAYWKAVSQFNEQQRRQLLKFVTSCSRPPLLGFKELFPAFCIHPSGTEDRLPSASTCMNLLKLPEYRDYDTLKEKLLYAIMSSAGFELS